MRRQPERTGPGYGLVEVGRDPAPFPLVVPIWGIWGGIKLGSGF